ncbi:MAG TPA: hypothetical protein VF460_02960 [Burkholderiales bacterium]
MSEFEAMVLEAAVPFLPVSDRPYEIFRIVDASGNELSFGEAAGA